MLVAYIYIGYPLLLLALSRLRPAPPVRKANFTPLVSLVVPAHNEEKVIAQKMQNALALDYPRHKLEIIVASDGSTDGTNEIVRAYAHRGVRLVGLGRKQGKSAAQNRAVATASGDVLFFTDANVLLRPDALRTMLRNFADGSVGCVVGKVTYLNRRDTSVSEGEGLYWRYELFLRGLESRLGNLAMGSGPIMAIRRHLFEPLDPDAGEDFVLPMQVAMKGYRVVYEPEAVSEEVLCQTTPASMLESKVRIITKDLRGLFLCRAVLNPLRYPLYAWGLISHKLLRWLVPYFLIALLAANLLLLGQPFYRVTLALQVAAYALAVIGYLWQSTDRKPPWVFGVPLSFCLVNLAALIGVARFLMGKRAGRWEPVRDRAGR